MIKMINKFVTAPLNFNALMTSGKKTPGHQPFTTLWNASCMIFNLVIFQHELSK